MKMHRGFTLIELLVVMAIIATLLSIATPRYFSQLQHAREASLRETLAVVRDAIDKYHTDTGTYPADLETLVTQRYLAKAPLDPINERTDTWVLVPAPGEAGVWDLHSGAETEDNSANEGSTEPSNRYKGAKNYADW